VYHLKGSWVLAFVLGGFDGFLGGFGEFMLSEHSGRDGEG